MITGRENYILSPTWGECRISYRGDMASSTITPAPAPQLVHGATMPDSRPDHPRHRLGDALRAIRVYAVAAVEVVVLGTGGKR